MSRNKKGNIGELEVARLIEPWWRGLEPDARVTRTPRSGGWTQGRDLFDARGDVMTTAERFPWVVEVKRREGWVLGRVLAGKPSPLWRWWEETCEDAAAAGRRPMLWARKNHAPDWLVLVARVHVAACPRAPMPDFFFGPLPTPKEPVAYWASNLLRSDPGDWARPR